MQTCAFDGALEDADPLVAEDGAALPAELALAPPVGTPPQTLPDGTELVESYFGVSWSGTGGDLGPSDSTSGVESAAVGEGLYVLGMRAGGRVLIRSASGETLDTLVVDNIMESSLGIPVANAAVRLALAGGTLAIADRAGTVSVVDPVTGAERWREVFGARGLAVSPDGARVAAATADAIRVWDAVTGETVAEWAGMERLHNLAFSSDGTALAVYNHGTLPTTSTRVTTRDHNNNPSSVARSETTTIEGAKPSLTVWRLPF